MSNFPTYAAALAETILLGNLAVWAAAGSTIPSAREAQKTKRAFKGRRSVGCEEPLTATNAPGSGPHHQAGVP